MNLLICPWVIDTTQACLWRNKTFSRKDSRSLVTYFDVESVSWLLPREDSQLAEMGDDYSTMSSILWIFTLGSTFFTCCCFSSSTFCSVCSVSYSSESLSKSNSSSESEASSSHKSISWRVIPLRASMTSCVVYLLGSLKKASCWTMFGWFASLRRAKI